jgi:serine/threonine-protein kinase
MKPANIMLTAGGGVKLTDFGIARFSHMDHTGAGMIGTPTYMAPEQFSGDVVDARADIYAVGVILYEILTGQQPYRGGGITAVMLASKGERAPAPSALAQGLPGALDVVVMKAICPDPMGRFASTAEMRAELFAAIGSHGATLIAPRVEGAAPSVETMIGRLSLTTMRQLEQSLVSQIGPIGKLLARRAAETAVSQEDLLGQVLAEISDPADREALRCQLAGYLRADPARNKGRITGNDLAPIIEALTSHLGPIAGTLVRRQAVQSASLLQLLERLAEAIPDAGARATFLEKAQMQCAKGAHDAGS